MEKNYIERKVDRVANRVMELLDQDETPLHEGYYPDLHTANGLIQKADEDLNAGGITGVMAGSVVDVVLKNHKRGKEFSESYYGGRLVHKEGVVKSIINFLNQKIEI